MPKIRTAATACAALLAIGVLASGCADSAGPIEVATDDPRTLPAPTPEDAAAWADGVIPENALGGASWTQREAGVLEPGREPIISVPAGDAPASVTIACVTGTASSLAYVVTAAGAPVADGTVACPAVDGVAEPAVIADLPAEATVELTAETTGLFVYAVRSAVDPAA